MQSPGVITAYINLLWKIRGKKNKPLERMCLKDHFNVIQFKQIQTQLDLAKRSHSLSIPQGYWHILPLNHHLCPFSSLAGFPYVLGKMIVGVCLVAIKVFSFLFFFIFWKKDQHQHHRGVLNGGGRIFFRYSLHWRRKRKKNKRRNIKGSAHHWNYYS